MSDAREPGLHFSEAARRIWVKLRRENRSLESIRTEIGLGRGQLNRYVYGDQLPNVKNAFLIADAIGFNPRLWLVKPASSFKLPGSPARRSARERARTLPKRNRRRG